MYCLAEAIKRESDNFVGNGTWVVTSSFSTMRILSHVARVTLLMAFAFGLHLCSANAAFVRCGLSHTPHHNRRHLPSHARSRVSSRTRRSQNWESPETALLEEAHLHPPVVARQLLHPETGYHSHPNVHSYRSSHAKVVAIALFIPALVVEPLAGTSVVARGSAPRAPGSSRGPPLS